MGFQPVGRVLTTVGLYSGRLGKSEAIFYIDHFCGLCWGGGSYILMRKANGVWPVVDQHSAWVS